jgi:hypothetical protein
VSPRVGDREGWLEIAKNGAVNHCKQLFWLEHINVFASSCSWLSTWIADENEANETQIAKRLERLDQIRVS